MSRRVHIERCYLIWTHYRVTFLFTEHLLSRLMRRATASTGRIHAESLLEFCILLLQLFDLMSFTLRLEDGGQWNGLENCREQVVQAEIERVLILLGEVDGESWMIFGLFAVLEVEKVTPFGLRVNLGCHFTEEVSDFVGLATLVGCHEIDFEETWKIDLYGKS